MSAMVAGREVADTLNAMMSTNAPLRVAIDGVVLVAIRRITPAIASETG